MRAKGRDMVHENKVIRSIEAPGGVVCVDFMRMSDGSVAFEQFRRDPEDGHGWRPAGGASGQGFEDLASAEAAARRDIGWLNA